MMLATQRTCRAQNRRHTEAKRSDRPTARSFELHLYRRERPLPFRTAVNPRPDALVPHPEQHIKGKRVRVAGAASNVVQFLACVVGGWLHGFRLRYHDARDMPSAFHGSVAASVLSRSSIRGRPLRMRADLMSVASPCLTMTDPGSAFLIAATATSTIRLLPFLRLGVSGCTIADARGGALTATSRMARSWSSLLMPPAVTQ